MLSGTQTNANATTVITELGYLGIGVSSLSQWKAFAAEVLGAEWLEDGATAFLRLDLWHHRIALHEDGSDDLAYIGWRVADDQALTAMTEKLTAAGFKVQQGSAAEAKERQVLGLIKLSSPGGIPTEIFYGPRIDAHKPFHPGRPMFGRFKTGGGGMGHLTVRENSEALSFYRLLGLVGGVEYQVELPGGMVAAPIFMHCNERQHSIGYALGPLPKRCHHIMLEYTDIGDLGLASDIVRQRKIDVTMSLGTHANDGAQSFYMATPSGFSLELGWDVKKPSAQAQYNISDVFGHHIDGQEGYGIGADKP